MPLLLIFLIALALGLVMWLGLAARSKAGTRIALAGLLSFTALVSFYLVANRPLIH